MHIEGSYRAFCFDQAVTTFGTATVDVIEKAVAKVKDDKARENKADQALRKMLGLPMRFRNPPASAAVRKKG